LKKITPEPVLLALLYTCTTLHYTKEFELLLGHLFTSSPPMHKSENSTYLATPISYPPPPFAHGDTRCQNERSSKTLLFSTQVRAPNPNPNPSITRSHPISHDNFSFVAHGCKHHDNFSFIGLGPRE